MRVEREALLQRMDSQDSIEFIVQLRRVAERCHGMAAEKGFYDEPRNFGEQIALMHSELSELLEANRASRVEFSRKIAGYSLEEEEAADLLIRLLDTAAHRKWRLGEAVLAKMNYNAHRPYKHDKKY